MTKARKDGTICLLCDVQLIDGRLVCTDCWKKVTLCKYCQERPAQKGSQCGKCKNTKKENKTKHKEDPRGFTDMLKLKSGK